ncbi:MAG TPA: carboxypeptidase-like regulatory domain-containing protein, partial [Kofleriaceae bacterium]|nr:carboxypeptidase-like regulatory domain-containing protein [Kofleriaceae bacterium]
MRLRCSLSFLVLAACAGEAPPDRPTDGDVDPPAATGQRVGGKAMDYFVANTPLQSTTITTDGIDPQLMTTSAADGAFAFESVPPGSQVFLSVSRTNYRPTRNAPVSVTDAAVTSDVYLLSNADVIRQYATDGKTPTAGKAFVVAELLRNNGTPLTGIPLTDIKLTDAADAPVPGVIGPYLFGALGDLTPAGVTQTAAFGGKVRVAFLDVPPGNFSLKVTFLDGQGQPQTVKSSVTAAADGATLVRSGGMGGGGGGAAGTGNIANPRFAQDVFPRLQTAANGGRACVNCHAAGGPGAVLVMNALPADVLATLK